MVNEAIFGALKSALVRGESLKKAMMTVYNAGYNKEEISEAANLINEGVSSPQMQPSQKVNVETTKKFSKTKMLAPSEGVPFESKQPGQFDIQVQQPQIPQQPQVAQQQVQQVTKQTSQGQKRIQKVSDYEQPPKEKSKAIIIILGFLLLFLIGILVAVFLFKEELLDFFNSLSG